MNRKGRKPPLRFAAEDFLHPLCGVAHFPKRDCAFFEGTGRARPLCAALDWPSRGIVRKTAHKEAFLLLKFYPRSHHERR